jgi:hypothetical protein
VVKATTTTTTTSSSSSSNVTYSLPADSSGLGVAATSTINDMGRCSSYPAGFNSAASDEHQSYSSKSRIHHLPYSAHPSADNLFPCSSNAIANHDYLPYSSSPRPGGSLPYSAILNPGSLPYSANPPHQEVYSTPVRSEILAYPDSPYNRRTESSAPFQENTNLDNHRQSGRGTVSIGVYV